MGKAILASAAYGWFAGMLAIMIVICILFGFIMYIALRPIRKDVPEETVAVKLRRREAEIASKLVNNRNDKQATDALMQQLREVESAQNIVKEIEPSEEKPAEAKPVKKAGAAKPAPKKASAPKPAPETVSDEKAKPRPAAPAPQKAAPKAEPSKESKAEHGGKAE